MDFLQKRGQFSRGTAISSKQSKKKLGEKLIPGSWCDLGELLLGGRRGDTCEGTVRCACDDDADSRPAPGLGGELRLKAVGTLFILWEVHALGPVGTATCGAAGVLEVNRSARSLSGSLWGWVGRFSGSFRDTTGSGALLLAGEMERMLSRDM